MLELEKENFKIKFSEMNLRQRMFENESYITAEINTEFYPSFVKESIVSGVVLIKLDLKDINKLSDLSEKTFSGDIGKVTISVNNEGVWETNTTEKFLVKFNRLNKNEIEFILETDICKLETTSTIVSLYTTSTTEEKLNKNFDMTDFHDKCIIKEIGKSVIKKYFVKGV